MANFHRLLTAIFFSLFFCSPAFSQSAPVGAIDLAGWIKGADGAYTKAFGESARVTLSSPPGGISTTSTALINTSKGIQAMDIVKTAAVDVNRVGAAVGNLAQRVGPVGMTLTTVSLVCELTTICQDGSDWLFGETTTMLEGAVNCSTVSGSTVYTKQSGAQYFNYKRIPCSDAVPSGWGFVSNCNCPFEDKLIQSAPFGSLPPAPHVPTAEEWQTKESLLNDDRFIPELIGKGESVPSNVPTLTPDQKKGLGLESKPTRDSSGNVTGREDTTTEIEAVDSGTTDNPGRVIIKETQTTIKYDINNNQISSTTNTSYSSQPQPDKPQQSFEIKFDEVPPAELQTHNVQATLTSNSWGEGTCPPDIPIDISYYPMNLVIPTAPVCDTAEKINPLVLLLASIAGVYIVSGVRSTEVK